MNTIRENPSPKSSSPLSLWEVLGEEYWDLGDGRPDAEYEELVSAYVNSRIAMEQAQVDLAAAEAKGLKEPSAESKKQSENSRGKSAGAESELATAESKGLKKSSAQLRQQYENDREEYAGAERDLANHLVALFHQHPRNALCFSGGGIRSASFCLGVLQALARHSAPDTKLFSEFHYLSTVSGGGYTGGWLSSWIKRENSPARVIETLGGTSREKLDPEPKPLLYLRNFVSYLNPQLGLLSADTWTLASTILRNVLLNWLVLIPLLAAVLALPQLVYTALLDGGVWRNRDSVLALLLAVSGVFGAIATAYIVYDLPKAIDARRSQMSFIRYCLVPVSLSTLGLTFYWAWYICTGGKVLSSWYAVAFAVGAVAVGLLIAFVIGLLRGSPRQWGWIAWGAFSTLAAAGGAAFVGYSLAAHFLNHEKHSPSDLRAYTWLAIPAGLVIIEVMQLLTVGLTSKYTEDEDREWWARSMAWLLITIVLWFSLAGVVLYATELFTNLKAMAISSSMFTTALGAIASRLGASSKTKAGRRNEQEPTTTKLPMPAIPADLYLKLVVPAFLVLLVISLACVNELLSRYLASAQKLSCWPGIHRPNGQPSFGNEVLLILLLLIPSLIAAFFINVNKFSLHAMYRLRLIRTFLGASNEERKPNPFTGFDPNDNCAVSELCPERPLHVINIALNLVKADKLAWQQRKAESFTVTRLHSGSSRVGYQRSKDYAKGDKGITLGGAIALSGAAASPNMGYHSSPLVTLIMTLFNARLGAWLANPGQPGKGIWDKEGPRYAVRPFVDEAFGFTTDTNAWVYLSDGGHFENLGLYEMVLRRCRNIVVVDASADPKFDFEDLGNAIRKIRIDMGIPIEFPGQHPIPATPGGESPHWAVAEIQYSCVDGKVPNGNLLYIKPLLNGNEPIDVLAYSRLQREFPHQSTVDQWFDEPQFESYRRLGFHSIDELLAFGGGPYGLSELFQKASKAK